MSKKTHFVTAPFLSARKNVCLKDRGGCAMIGEEKGESVWTGTGYRKNYTF